MALIGLQPSFAGITVFKPTERYTVQQVIDLILKKGNLKPIPGTVDTIKSGSADMVVTGIVTTMFATITVIEATAKLGANFIIAHEPTFYNHQDNVDWVAHNSVVKEKQALLARHKITIWRFHDYIHSLVPDAVIYGVAKKLGWLPYFKKEQFIFNIPELSLADLIQHFKSSLGIAHVRIIGDINQKCETVVVIPGAAGGIKHVTAAETIQPDVIVVGEMSEWETAEYIRDARLLGRKTALIVLGHNFSEDPGMEYLVEWLQPILPGIKITHIASGDPFTWM